MLHVIRNRLDQLTTYLEPLLPFANCHMVDYFIKDLFDLYIPSEICLEIRNSPQTVLNSILTDSTDSFSNLHEFLAECQSHTLANYTDTAITLEQFELKLREMRCNLSELQIKGFMTPKKLHEVKIMGVITTAIHELSKTTHIIDIGDGKGYLSSALAFHNRLKVLGIDSSVINTKGASKRTEKLKKHWKGITETPINETDSYKQITEFVTIETDLKSLITDNFPSPEPEIKIGLVGLHTCGNLAPSCLGIFTANDEIKSICNIGCCYHLLPESGFPMSRYLAGFNLSRNCRMLSCESLDRILSKQELPNQNLFYRALLQIILVTYCPHLVEKQVGRVKKPMTFLNYVQFAFKKFETELPIGKDEISELYNNYKHLEVELHIFYLIRAHLAPIIESILLLDRLLFLYEHKYSNSFLIRMFDPVISPRCYGLISFKNDWFVKIGKK